MTTTDVVVVDKQSANKVKGNLGELELGAMSSGYSLVSQKKKAMVDGDSALAVMGSVPVMGGFAGGLIMGSLILGSLPGAILAAAAVPAFLISRAKIKNRQIKSVFKKVAKNADINSELIAYAQTDIHKYRTHEQLSKYSKSEAYNLAFKSGTVARVYIHWESWSIAIFEYEVFRGHIADLQIKSWDDAFNSAKALKQ